MVKSRTACPLLFPCAYPEELPQREGKLELPLEDVANLFPDGAVALLGLRDGEWSFTGAQVDDGGGCDDDDRPLRDVSIWFDKEFVPARVEGGLGA
jgi:hypothetical protein